MKWIANLVVALAVFAVGFGGTFWYQTRSSPLGFAAPPAPEVNCDIADEGCRANHRAQAEFNFRAGKVAAASATLSRLVSAGDKVAAFLLGWHHEEIYRAAVGRKLVAGASVEEERRFGVLDLPRGEAFDALVARAMQGGGGETERARTLAFLWYAKAAQGGFAPAMNNLANMYRFGLLGAPDPANARKWFLAAYDAGSPVAAYNLENMRIKTYGVAEFDCVEQAGSGWLPLVNRPSAVDLSAEVFTRTRFRGRAPGRAIIGVIGNDVVGVTDPAVWSRAAGRPAEQVGWIRAAIEAVKSDGDDWDYDDEVPTKPKDMPSFAAARQLAQQQEETRGSCASYSADRRSAAIEAARERRDALVDRFR